MSGGDVVGAEELRRHAERVTEWIATYLSGEGERLPVLSRARPGDLQSSLPASPPDDGEPLQRILDDFEALVVPGITHWNQPGFLAYFANSSTVPAILAEYLSAALNVNGMLWKSSPAATELEIVAVAWLRQLLGLPDGLFGVIQDTASASTLVALAAARETVPGLEVRRRGLVGQARLRMYASEQAHSSVEKAGIVLGVGQEGLRKIPTDDEFRLDAGALARAIREDRESGFTPFAVTATVGTTSTSSIDPVPEIASICRQEGVWLHVDAAYAGPAACVPELRWLLDGCELADSIVVNPHKWLFVPIDLSVLYTPHPERVRAAFSLVPDYLKTPEDAVAPNLMDYGVSLGRRFRALKLWMVIRAFGARGLAERIARHVEIAQSFRSWIEADPAFEVVAPSPLSLVCFRARGVGLPPERQDELNQRLMDRLNGSGEAFISHARLHGRFVLRLAIGNVRTEERHVRRAYEILRDTERELRAP